jgi:hypothetical protein
MILRNENSWPYWDSTLTSDPSVIQPANSHYTDYTTLAPSPSLMSYYLSISLACFSYQYEEYHLTRKVALCISFFKVLSRLTRLLWAPHKWIYILCIPWRLVELSDHLQAATTWSLDIEGLVHIAVLLNISIHFNVFMIWFFITQTVLRLYIIRELVKFP